MHEANGDLKEWIPDEQQEAPVAAANVAGAPPSEQDAAASEDGFEEIPGPNEVP